MEDYISMIMFLVIYTSLSYVYTKNALHMFQQSRYELKRYNKWLFNKNNIHFTFAFVYITIELIIYIFSINFPKRAIIFILLNLTLTIIYTIFVINRESNKKYIKDLVVTNRVIRQIIVIIVLIVCLLLKMLSSYKSFCFIGVFSIYGPYVLIYPMAIITYPIEEIIKKYYENKAKNKLNSFDHLIKIGITGSYGKTSTKNIVNDILKTQYFSLMTPSSFNTPMGITRTIREQLKIYHNVFICEMGADKKNDISYLMNFVKPKYGIITSIGPQHLMSFKTIENIINEKMKEIEMLPEDGVGFINVDNEYINNYRIRNKCKIVTVGINNENADYVAKKIKYSKNGTSFTVKIANKNYTFTTSLLGQHNINNILIGIAIGIELNIPIKNIVEAVKSIKQIEHRLEVKTINNLTIIDDAFNSNPVGSKMALDVLKLMSSKRVIVTPGMIDLGKSQDQLNYEFGKYMFDKVDFVILVGEKQTKYIYEGLKDSKYDMNNVKVFASIMDAMAFVYKTFTSKDTILLENDLPDAFNV